MQPIRDDLSVLNGNDIYPCLSSSSLFLIPFMLTCSMMKFLSFLLRAQCACVVSESCGRLWSVCEVVYVLWMRWLR